MKVKPLHEKLCPNLWLVVYVTKKYSECWIVLVKCLSLVYPVSETEMLPHIKAGGSALPQFAFDTHHFDYFCWKWESIPWLLQFPLPFLKPQKTSKSLVFWTFTSLMCGSPLVAILDRNHNNLAVKPDNLSNWTLCWSKRLLSLCCSPGWFFDYTQSYDLAFYFSGGIVVVGSLILFLLTLPCCNRRPSKGDRPDVHYTSNCDKVASVAWTLDHEGWNFSPVTAALDTRSTRMLIWLWTGVRTPLISAARVLYAKTLWRFKTVPWVHFSGSNRKLHISFSLLASFRRSTE